MGAALKPETADQVLTAVEWAAAEGKSLEVRGQGSKRGLGRSTETDEVLDLTALSGVQTYEPGELVLSAFACTPIAEITALLTENGQRIDFEPPDLGPLLGGAADKGSLGGLIACNLAGPRRVKTGAARDHFLGFNAVSGRGEVFKSGGKVVKNVTGFDLSKLIAGSYGTLAIMTDVNLKVVPAPEKVRTVLVTWSRDGVYDHGGIQAMTEALGSSHEVSGAAHLPAAVAGRSAVDHVSASGGAVTAVRVEGPDPSVKHRCQALKDMLAKFGQVEELHTTNSAALWKEVADVAYFVEPADRSVWRLSVPPAAGSRVALKILESQAGEVFYDWGGGLIWLATKPGDDAGAAVIRAAVAEAGGHAMLVRAADAVRSQVAVFTPQSDALTGVTKGVKDGFDPSHILNPGRMYEGV